MLIVGTIAKVRRDHIVDKKPIKAIARDRGLSRNTVRKVLRSRETSFSYQRGDQPYPKLGPYLEELERLCRTFINQGVRRLRLTGGEPLVRRNIMWLFQQLGRHLDSGALDELTVTTNGSQLSRHAAALYACGVRRINVSLDTLNHDKFLAITRWGKFDRVIAGIDAALEAGLAVKINAVAMRDLNEDEFDQMIAWCGERGMDLTLIEAMPMGDIGQNRAEQHLSLRKVRQNLEQSWTLLPSDHQTA